MTTIKISHLNHTWLIDIDGTLMLHNGYKNKGDSLLLGVKDFWKSIPENDVIILLSARREEEKLNTLKFLDGEGIRYNHAIFNLPTGERILINDTKPKGLFTALAVNIKRDIGLSNINIDLIDC